MTRAARYVGPVAVVPGIGAPVATALDLTPNFWSSARVTGWFGGNEVAPRTLSYFQHL
jgi:hypothetical protein